MTPAALTGYREPAEGQPREGATVALFLALYLVLLAFFILLVAISEGHSHRSSEIFEGLSSRFAARDAEGGESPSFASDLGRVISPAEYLDTVTRVYESAIPATRVEEIVPGRVMQMVLHVDSLFEHDTETLRPAQRRAFAELVASLSAPPPGLAYVVEAAFGVADPENLLPVASGRAARRAAIVAEAFAAEGAPPGAAVAALESGDPLAVRLIFRVEDRRGAS